MDEREQMYIDALANGTIPPEPITRTEHYLAKMCGMDVELPMPITRRELFFAYAAGMEIDIPEPITREETYLAAVGAGSSETLVQGALPITITDAMPGAPLSMTRYGKCWQNTTPSLYNPAPFVSNCGTLRYSPNRINERINSLNHKWWLSDGTAKLLAVNGWVSFKSCSLLANTQYTLHINSANDIAQITCVFWQTEPREYVQHDYNVEQNAVTFTTPGWVSAAVGCFLAVKLSDSAITEDDVTANTYMLAPGATPQEYKEPKIYYWDTPEILRVNDQLLTVEPLLSVEDPPHYASDAQAIISGEISPAVGLYVELEGGNWYIPDDTAIYEGGFMFPYAETSGMILCTHFPAEECFLSLNSGGVYADVTIRLPQELRDVNALTEYFQMQEVAGTPVMFVYQQLNQEARQVEPQSVSLEFGTNHISSSSENARIAIGYNKKGVI